MVGGKVQGANVADFSSGVVTLYTLGSAPPERTLTSQAVSYPGAFRYVRYLGPANGSCNVAEVQFLGYANPASTPAAPLNPRRLRGKRTGIPLMGGVGRRYQFQRQARLEQRRPLHDDCLGSENNELSRPWSDQSHDLLLRGVGRELRWRELPDSVEVAATPVAPWVNWATNGTAADSTGTSPGAGGTGQGTRWDDEHQVVQRRHDIPGLAALRLWHRHPAGRDPLRHQQCQRHAAPRPMRMVVPRLE